MTKHTFTPSEISRIVEMGWEDRTPFDAIKQLYNLNENQTINFMRQQLKPRSFRLWRKRMYGRTTKHQALRSKNVTRGYCPTQYKR